MDTEAAVGAVALGMAETVGLYIAALIIGGGAGAVLGTLMFGRRYKQRIAALEARLSSAPATQTVTINMPPDAGNQTQKTSTTRPASSGVKSNVAQHIPSEDLLRIGTTLGPMTVRLNHKMTVADVLKIMSRHDILASLDDHRE